jgi:hypothetical protein
MLASSVVVNYNTIFPVKDFLRALFAKWSGLRITVFSSNYIRKNLPP